jgi:uncharacterized protein (TIGR02147 family)
MLSRATIKEQAAKIDASQFMDAPSYLKRVYDSLKLLDADMTYKKFSELVGLGSSNAHLVMNGKRELTLKAAEKIADALGLVRDQRRYFMLLAEYQRQRDPTERELIYRRLLNEKSKSLDNELSRKQLEFFGQWYHAAILELFRLPDAVDSPEWISSQLGPRLSATEIKHSLNLIKELGHLALNSATGKWQPTEELISTGDEIAGMAIYRFHQQMIDLAKIAMDEVEAEDREISALTFAANGAVRIAIKQRIVQFRKELLELAQTVSNPDQVIQINFQMFPVTDRKRKKS